MKNIYTIVVSAFIVIVSGIMPSVSDAASFQPTSRTYYPDTGAGVQPITIINNNVNNNVNTDTLPVQAVKTVKNAETTKKTTKYTYSDLTNLAQNNLPKQGTQRTVATYSLTNRGSYGASVAYGSVAVAKPTCSLVPAIGSRGGVELQWRTSGATVAYINDGIGHVNVISGKRSINPSKDTVYNLTVLNDAGIAGSCSARVNVSMVQPNTLAIATVASASTNSNYSYSVSGGTDYGANTADNNLNNNVTNNTNSNDDESDSGEVSTEVESASTSTSTFFGDTFKTVAIPIGLVFLVLIVILVILMSRVKAAK